MIEKIPTIKKPELTIEKKVLNYLTDWKSSRQIREKFDLSNTRFYTIIKWARKMNLIEVMSCSGVEKHKTNRTFLYKRI